MTNGPGIRNALAKPRTLRMMAAELARACAPEEEWTRMSKGKIRAGIATPLACLAGALAIGAMASPAFAGALIDGQSRIGVGCHLSNKEELPVPAAADAICAEAIGTVERLAGPDRTVVRIDFEDEAAVLPDYPVVLIDLELRPDWTGKPPRLMIRAVPLRGGRGVISTALPAIPVNLQKSDWADQARASLTRMIDFVMR